MLILPAVLAARLRQIGFEPASVESSSRKMQDLNKLLGLKASGNVFTVPEGAGTPPGRIIVFRKPISANESEAKLLESIKPHLNDYRARYNLTEKEIQAVLTKEKNFWLLQVTAAAGIRF